MADQAVRKQSRINTKAEYALTLPRPATHTHTHMVTCAKCGVLLFFSIDGTFTKQIIHEETSTNSSKAATVQDKSLFLVCLKLGICNKSSSENKFKKHLQKFPKVTQAFGDISLKEGGGATACEQVPAVGEGEVTPEAEFLLYCIANSFCLNSL